MTVTEIAHGALYGPFWDGAPASRASRRPLPPMSPRSSITARRSPPARWVRSWCWRRPRSRRSRCSATSGPSSPILRRLVVSENTDELRLIGNISIAVHTNNYRTIRGRTLLACIFDEVAFWRDETTSLPDVETYRAVLPALATTGGMLVGISSPYAQRGLLHAKHRDHFGAADDRVLVVQAGTRAFNPTIDELVLEEAQRDDPESAAAEWDGQFRNDLSTFIDPAIVLRGIDPGVRERPFDQRHRYFAFCDPSGGAHDAMTIGIAHVEGERAILDCLREVRPPFDPSDVVLEFVRLLGRYRISTVTGDRYAAEWVVGPSRCMGFATRRARSAGLSSTSRRCRRSWAGSSCCSTIPASSPRSAISSDGRPGWARFGGSHAWRRRRFEQCGARSAGSRGVNATGFPAAAAADQGHCGLCGYQAAAQARKAAIVPDTRRGTAGARRRLLHPRKKTSRLSRQTIILPRRRRLVDVTGTAGG